MLPTHLATLHEKISAICPISGLSEDDSGAIIDVEYVDPPTAEQETQIQALIAAWPAEKVRLDQLAALDAEWANTVKQGWTTPGGWKLGLEPTDVMLLTGAYMLAKEAAALNMPLPEIIDMAGVAHSFAAIDEFTALMLQYGQARAALSAQYAANKAAIG